MIYHITSAEQWAAAQAAGVYRAESLLSEGFIHLSQRHQVLGSANRFFQGQAGLELLAIDPAQLTGRLVYEAPVSPESHAAGETFPHLYGELNLDAVVQVVSFVADADGRFTLPDDLI